VFLVGGKDETHATLGPTRRRRYDFVVHHKVGLEPGLDQFLGGHGPGEGINRGLQFRLQCSPTDDYVRPSVAEEGCLQQFGLDSPSLVQDSVPRPASTAVEVE
jgi:hypothetical protein